MEKETRIPCEKLKELDKYAKELGLTIYDIVYGFEYKEQILKHHIYSFNTTPELIEENPNAKGFVQCI